MINKAVVFIHKILNKKQRRQEVIADFHTTIMRVDDNFISSSSIILDEVLKGNIYSLKEVIVAGTAEISGNITSRTASISGKVYGDIIATDYAEIKSTAIISGHIKVGLMSIEAGAVINGSIRIKVNIDETDLLDKIQNRLTSKSVEEPAFLTFILPEVETITDAVTKPEIRPAEVSKRLATSASLKNKITRPVETEDGEKPTAPNGWY